MREKNIVLIEDNPDHAEIITEVLCDDDIERNIVMIRDGKEAIDYFQCETQSQISLVILDLNLPKIGGMKVLRFIKETSKYCSTPVIVLSTSSEQKTIDEAYKNGANGYFTKPASYEDFVEKVKILKKCS